MSARALALAILVVGCNPGGDAQRLPIGVACNTSGQCGTGKFFCDKSHVDGYCKADCGKDADCPSGAVCVGAGMITSGACAKTCANGVGDCRAGDLCMTSDASAAYCDAPPIVDLAGSD